MRNPQRDGGDRRARREGTYPAEYRFSASQINIVSKGGGNKLHGAIFEDNRNNAYDALPFPTALDFNSGIKTSIPILRQNQFGFVASGPVYIPKVYDGRNKSFFMANYEGWRINNGSIAKETVPNPAVLTGDFSAESYAAGVGGLPGGPLPAYGTAACSTLLDNGYNCMPVDPTTGNPFPGNKIPTSAFTSRIGLVAVNHKYWAAPTIPNQPEAGYSKGLSVLNIQAGMVLKFTIVECPCVESKKSFVTGSI